MYALREVNVNTMIVDQDALHLEVGLLTVLSMLKLDKGVLKAIARSLLSNHLAREDLAETAEDELEVLVCAPDRVSDSRRTRTGKGSLSPTVSDGVKLADEEHVLGRLHLGKRKVADHL